MTVHFIGAGPGAADLLTLRGPRLIAECPVCVYAGSLVPAEVLAHAPAGARAGRYAAPVASTRSSRSCARRTSAARTSRACTPATSRSTAPSGEQTRRLDELGIPWDVTPGVPAFAAAAATLRRELTLPGVAQTVILTRHSGRSTAMPAGEELAALARTRDARPAPRRPGDRGDRRDADAALRRRLPGRRWWRARAGRTSWCSRAHSRRSRAPCARPACGARRSSSSALRSPRRASRESHLYSPARERPAPA